MSILSFCRNYLWKTSTPWADLSYDGNQLVIKSYNKAFAEQQRGVLGSLADEKSDDEVVKLFVDRENIKYEEPRLDVLHMGIKPDGRVEMKFDWNQAFINHLMAHGFQGGSEDEIIQNYLNVLSSNTLEDMGMFNEEPVSRENIEEMYAEQNEELKRELREAETQMRRYKRRSSK